MHPAKKKVQGLSASGKKTNRFPYLIAGLGSYFFTGCLYVWSYFRPVFRELYPDWTTSQMSFIFSIHSVFITLGSLFCGIVLKKVPPRKKQYIQIALIVTGLGGFRFLPPDNPMLALVMAGIFFAFFAAIAVGMLAVITLDVYPTWFPERLGVLNGSMTLCMGFCPIIIGAIASRLIPYVGPLEALSWIGIFIGCCLLLTSIFLRRPGPDDVLPPAPIREENKTAREFTAKEALSGRAFWLLFGFNVCMRANGLTIVDFASTIALAFGASAFIGLCFSPAIAFGGIGSGTLVDKLGSYRTMMIFGTIVICSGTVLILGNQTGTTLLMILGLTLAGFGYGGTTAASAASIRVLFGSKNYASVFSCMQCAIIPGCTLQFVNGLIIERMNGSLLGVFILTTVYGSLAALCGFGLRREVKKTLAAAQGEGVAA